MESLHSASTAIKIFNSSDANIGIFLHESEYVNDRMPYRPKFIDKSRLKIGRQSFHYRIKPLFAKMSFDWTNQLSDAL
jgi:hypothetical protein